VKRSGDPIRVDRGLVFFLALVTAVVTAVHMAGDIRYDFGVFYYAGRMVWEGAGKSLYDLNQQHAFQVRYGRPPDFLFYYPPFALLPFLPLTLLPAIGAFILWTAFNVGLVTAAIAALSRRFDFRYGNWPLLLSFAFMPVASNLANGQLSLLALAGYVWCYMLWRRGRLFQGGLALALVAFKPQLVAGFLCILLIKRRWRELAGFATACIPLLMISWLIVGTRGLLQYPAFLSQCEVGPGIHPLKMANLRGLVTLFGGEGHQAIVVILSLAILPFAAWLWTDLDTGFSAAILYACLVSYHFNPQDLSVALIPVFMVIRTCGRRTASVLVASALVLPLVFSLFGGVLFALLALPLIAMLVWIRSGMRLVEPRTT